MAFSSDAVNFTTPAQEGIFFDVYVRDRQGGTTELASPNGDGDEANGQSEGPDISPDGRFVSFSSFATDLVAGTIDADELLQDAFVHDRVTGSTEMVSVAADHSDATFSGFDTHVASGPVSADGVVSLMTTNADNLFPGDTNLTSDVYANDRRPATDVSLTIEDNPDPVAPRDDPHLHDRGDEQRSKPGPRSGGLRHAARHGHVRRRLARVRPHRRHGGVRRRQLVGRTVGDDQHRRDATPYRNARQHGRCRIGITRPQPGQQHRQRHHDRCEVSRSRALDAA